MTYDIKRKEEIQNYKKNTTLYLHRLQNLPHISFHPRTCLRFSNPHIQKERNVFYYYQYRPGLILYHFLSRLEFFGLGWVWIGILVNVFFIGFWSDSKISFVQSFWVLLKYCLTLFRIIVVMRKKTSSYLLHET